MIWLTPAEWVPWVMQNHPERIRDPRAEAVAQLRHAFETEANRRDLMRQLSNAALTAVINQLASSPGRHAPQLIAEVQAVLRERKGAAR